MYKSQWKEGLLKSYKQDRKILLKRIAYLFAWCFVYTLYLILRDSGHDVLSSLMLGGFIGILINYIK